MVDIPAEEWFAAHKGRTFKRPKGKRTYTAEGLVHGYVGDYPVSMVRCRTDLGQMMEISWHTLRRMEMIG